MFNRFIDNTWSWESQTSKDNDEKECPVIQSLDSTREVTRSNLTVKSLVEDYQYLKNSNFLLLTIAFLWKERNEYDSFWNLRARYRISKERFFGFYRESIEETLATCLYNGRPPKQKKRKTHRCCKMCDSKHLIYCGTPWVVLWSSWLWQWKPWRELIPWCSGEYLHSR